MSAFGLLRPGRAAMALWISALLVTISGPSGAVAAQSAGSGAVPTKETSLQRIQRMVARINAEASTPEGEARVLERLSKQLGVAPDSLREQHELWGLGYGEVAMVYGFVRASKRPVLPEDVVEMRRSGMAWDAVGKSLGVKVDAVASKMRKNFGRPAAPAR
jgi:hypothetical protein